MRRWRPDDTVRAAILGPAAGICHFAGRRPHPRKPHPACRLSTQHWGLAAAERHRFPDKPFVLQRDSEGAWRGPTYAEALARVNRLSNGLLALGLDGSRPIAIMSENSVEMALVQLAAMQVGLAVAPISYAYSAMSKTGGHIKHILDVTQAPLVVMSDADLHMPKLSQWDLSGIQLFAVSHAENHEHAGVQPLSALEADDATLTSEGEARFAAVTHDTLAKIQFTSGSTNLPKGVEVTHGMQTSNQVGIAQLWPFLGADEVAVDFLPWNHTFGGNFIFNMLLMHGGTLHIDRGNPSPQGFETMVRNIMDVRPTIYSACRGAIPRCMRACRRTARSVTRSSAASSSCSPLPPRSISPPLTGCRR